MASSSQIGFNHASGSSPFHNWRAVPIQPQAMSSAARLHPGAANSSGTINSLTGMMVTGDPGIMTNAPSMVQAGGSSSKILPAWMPAPKHRLGIRVVWSPEEQAVLMVELAKNANLPSMYKYIKTASPLREKTVRDVALRCRWMTKKQNRKGGKANKKHGKKQTKDKKMKMVAASSNAKELVIPSGSTSNLSYPMQQVSGSTSDSPLIMQQVTPSFQYSCEVIDAMTQHLMDENALLLHQISANLESLKIQHNVDFFKCMSNNITTVLNNMSKMPGIMRLMPSLPEAINEELVKVLDSINQEILMGDLQASFYPRQGPY